MKYIAAIKFKVRYQNRSKFVLTETTDYFNLRLLDLDYYLGLDGVEIENITIVRIKAEVIKKKYELLKKQGK